jgi:hypothetical protein
MDWYNSTGIYDNSTWNNFGTFNGGLSSSNINAGKYGYGLQFDGNNDHLNCGNSSVFPTGDQLTLEAWINLDQLPTSHGDYESIITKKNTQLPWETYWFEIYNETTNSNTIMFGIVNNTGDDIISGSTWSVMNFSEDTWYHVVGILRVGSIPEIYVNGVNVTNWNYNGAWNGTIYPSAGNLYIGSFSNGANDNNFNGTIDEVRIWNRALSPEEINASYNSGLYRLYHNFTNLPDGSYQYYAYSIDSNGYANKTETRTLSVDTHATLYSNNATNNTLAGQPALFSLNWSDNIGLNGYIFSTNNSGSWTNDTWRDFENQTGNSVFMDSLESGNYTAWDTLMEDAGGNVEMSSSRTNHGSYSFLSDTSSAGGARAWVRKAFS